LGAAAVGIGQNGLLFFKSLLPRVRTSHLHFGLLCPGAEEVRSTSSVPAPIEGRRWLRGRPAPLLLPWWAHFRYHASRCDLRHFDCFRLSAAHFFG